MALPYLFLSKIKNYEENIYDLIYKMTITSRYVFWFFSLDESFDESESGIFTWKTLDYIKDRGQNLGNFLFKNNEYPCVGEVGSIFWSILKPNQYLIVNYDDYGDDGQFITTEPEIWKPYLTSHSFFNDECRRRRTRSHPAFYSAIIDWNGKVWKPPDVEFGELLDKPEELSWKYPQNCLEDLYIDDEDPPPPEYSGDIIVHEEEKNTTEPESCRCKKDISRPGIMRMLFISSKIGVRNIMMWNEDGSPSGGGGKYTLSTIGYMDGDGEYCLCELLFESDFNMPRLASLVAGFKDYVWESTPLRYFEGNKFSIKVYIPKSEDNEVRVKVFVGL
jgi:hypothetical protein